MFSNCDGADPTTAGNSAQIARMKKAPAISDEGFVAGDWRYQRLRTMQSCPAFFRLAQKDVADDLLVKPAARTR